MQTQVLNQPRTGREPIWYFEVYRGNQPGHCDFGQLFEYDDVKRKIVMHTTPQSFVRVIGPQSATAEQLEELRQMGARLTFP